MIAPVFVRALPLQLPYNRGPDVLALQSRLMQLGARTGVRVLGRQSLQQAPAT